MFQHVGPWEGIVYYTQSIAAMWAEKAVISTLIAGFVSLFGGDAVLIWLLIVMWLTDFAFGLAEAIRRGHFRCRVLTRGVLKFPTYCLYLLLVGVVNVSLSRALGLQLPILDLFVAYLVVTDAVSVMGHMIRLGMPVPLLLRRIVLRGQAGIERKVEAILKDAENDEEQ